MVAGVALEEDELVPPLAHGQEEGEEHRADEEPGGDRDADDQAARHDPDDEPGRDHEDVQDDDVLEPEGIQDLQDEVTDGDEEEGHAEGGRQPEAGGGQDDHGRDGRRLLEPPRGQGPLRLDGVEPVLLEVADVVEDVMGARDEAEGDEGGHGPQDERPVEELPGEDDGGENEEILDPLLGPERFEYFQEHQRTLYLILYMHWPENSIRTAPQSRAFRKYLYPDRVR